MASDGRPPGKVLPSDLGADKRGLVALGILILWVVGLNTIGFLVTSLAALCVITVWFDPRRRKRISFEM